MGNDDPLRTARDYYQYKLLMTRSSSRNPDAPTADQETLAHLGAVLEHVQDLEFEKARAERHLESLVSIGNALSMEKDFNALLRRILRESKSATGADAGSIYMIEEVPLKVARENNIPTALPDGSEELVEVLRFKYSHTFSKDLPYEERIMALDTRSIAGFVAVTGRVLAIPDVYNLTSEDPVSFNSSFDRRFNYRTKSMLVVPMRNHSDKVIGVIQLINCKDTTGMSPGQSAFSVRLASSDDYLHRVVAFPDEYVLLLQTIASQASIAVENSRMIWQIEHQFEQFVKASVNAIESRDKATSGHSFRVAESCLQVAMAINGIGEGRFKDTSFDSAQLRELEYAALLHDYGKVYVDPLIFLKGKKLYDTDLQALRLRLSLLYRSLELRGLTESGLCSVADMPEPFAGQLARLRAIIAEVAALNEPTVTDSDPAEQVEAIRALQAEIVAFDLEDRPIPILTEEEARKLSIRKGTLTAAERDEIQSHVEHSHNVLSRIPWPPELRNIPDIAYKHHEQLDGSGYVKRIAGDEIPLQARIMAIADVFDALISDRPYKKGQPFEKCCAILRGDARRGKLDADLVELLISIKSSLPDPA
jgi:HD-GYP domain-containing protein (c-di-GMP phosphodiesterase class II)